MKVIDLRSDTVTQPTPEMRRAMYEAEVGDDVYGEDPTVNRLEAMAAERMGKEAALFTVSGSMSNLVAGLTHCQRGDEMITGADSHIFYYEVGSVATLGGVQIRLLPNDAYGRLDPKAVEAAIRGINLHLPPTGLICLENPHNRCGGTVLPPDYIESISEIAQRHGVPLYLDGARIFNAAIYLGIDARELTKYVTSVSFCLSKGLSAPVGSLLCGDADFIRRARKNRKRVGGGMRQAGILAAAGIVALERMVNRLAEDHENARYLAENLAEIPGLSVDLALVQTNIVAVRVEKGSAGRVEAELAKEGVKVSNLGDGRLRLVTHYGIERADVATALKVIRDVMRRQG
ncbi:MAG TPA: low-specificity L-threonine aldolase [Dehalococcoidia bacterium]|nr:low-specificity L-threonine aldolase [Dehalococcoidia bacterium]